VTVPHRAFVSGADFDVRDTVLTRLGPAGAVVVAHTTLDTTAAAENPVFASGPA
jgi:hypothetical protein